MYHCAEVAVNLSELLKYFHKGERTDQIRELRNKSAATSGKRNQKHLIKGLLFFLSK